MWISDSEHSRVLSFRIQTDVAAPIDVATRADDGDVVVVPPALIAPIIASLTEEFSFVAAEASSLVPPSLFCTAYFYCCK